MAFNPYAPPADNFGPPPGALPSGSGPVGWEAGEVMGQAWEIFKRQWVTFFFGPLIAMFAAGIPGQIINQVVATSTSDMDVIIAAGVISGLINLVVQTYMYAGLYKMCLGAARNGMPQLGELFQGGSRFLALLGATLLMNLLIIVGFICLIIPGIIVAYGLSMTPYFVIDQGLGPVEAIKASWNATDGHKGKLFVYSLLSMLVMFAGLLCCCIGMYGAIGVVFLGNAIIYTRLTGTMGHDTFNPYGGFGGPPAYGPPGYGPQGGYGPPPGYGGPPPGGGYGGGPSF